jgi:hypothetical protein
MRGTLATPVCNPSSTCDAEADGPGRESVDAKKMEKLFLALA